MKSRAPYRCRNPHCKTGQAPPKPRHYCWPCYHDTKDAVARREREVAAKHAAQRERDDANRARVDEARKRREGRVGRTARSWS